MSGLFRHLAKNTVHSNSDISNSDVTNQVNHSNTQHSADLFGVFADWVKHGQSVATLAKLPELMRSFCTLAQQGLAEGARFKEPSYTSQVQVRRTSLSG